MIKVDVISGFLGAGKTTLIKKLFESSFNSEKVVLIENEFGEIGIDSSFLKESGIQIKEINAGCICCSLVGDFATSIKELVDTYHPERIIIEPSGVGKLSDIVNAIKDVHLDELQLNILATVVDGPKAKMYLKNFGEFFVNQVESADTIIVSKLDKMDNNKIDDVVHIIKEHNNHANIITTSIQDFESDKLLTLLEEKKNLSTQLLLDTLEEVHHHDEEHCCCGHHHDHHEHHHHDEHCECGCHDEHHHHEHHHHDEDECCCGHHHDHHEHHHHDEHCECSCHDEHHHDNHHHEHHDEDCCHHHNHHEHHHHNEHCECGCHHDHHHADEIFKTWGIETAKSISYEQLSNFLNHLANDEDLGIIVRSKGIIKASDKDTWYYFDFVSGDYEIREGAPDYTGRVVVIGANLNVSKVEQLFLER